MASFAKSKGIYIILGILFGGFGFHNFYSGHVGTGATKLFLFLIAFFLDLVTGFYSAFSLLALGITWLWSLIEAFTVTKDSRGNLMQ